MGTVSFTTADGHNCTIVSSPKGFHLSVIPNEPPFEAEILDIFYLGLKHGSAVRVLDAIQQSRVYVTRDKTASLSVTEGRCVLSFSSKHLEGKTFVCDLGNPGTAEFADFLSRALHGSTDTIVAGFEGPLTAARIGRNEPCPCGSGKKYKKCHLGKQFELPDEITEFSVISDPYVRMELDHARADPRAVRNAEFWNGLGSALGTSGNPLHALRCFERALSLDRAPEYLLNYAATLGVLRRYDKALEVLEEVPDDWRRKAVITANTLQDMGLHEEAIVQFEKAIEEEPDFFLPYARILNSLKAIDSPLYEYWLGRGIKAVPTSATIGVAYCRYLRDSLRLEELAAADWIDRLSAESGRPDLIDRNENDPRLIVEAQLFRAAALVAISEKLEDLEDAVSILTAANPAWRLCDPAKVLTATAANLGQPELAEEAYAKICPHCREHGIGVPRSLVEILARANLCANRYKEAVALCERALEEGPDNREVLWDYWWALDEIGEGQKAIHVAERLYGLDPDRSDLRYNLGFLCGKDGQFGKAKYYYEEQIAKVPKHVDAMENITFVHILETELSRAEETWGVFVDTLRERFDGYFFANSDEELMDGEFVSLDEYIAAKERKYRGLLDLATKSIGNPTYSLDLVEANNATHPRLGATTAIGKARYSVEDLIAGLSSHPSPASEELRFQLKAQQREDFSAIVTQLQERLPNWSSLPDFAQRSLIEGEHRWTLRHSADYSPVVMTFAKAVEISMKTLLFDSFRADFRANHDADQHLTRAKRDKKSDRVERFFKFLSKGEHLELGSMALTLELSTGKTAKRLFALGSFAEFIRTKGKAAFLDPTTHQQIHQLARDYRNPAVHARVQDQESAARARDLALTVLSLF